MNTEINKDSGAQNSPDELSQAAASDESAENEQSGEASAALGVSGRSDDRQDDRNTDKKSFAHTFFDAAELFIITLFIVLGVTSVFFRHSIVDGPSMMNTLTDGDHLIISDIFYEPKAGDIVVCYSDQLKKNIVKRVIATEGQTVVIKNNEVYVDSVKLDEDYVYIDNNRYRYQDGQWTVSDGCIFVMGDHRNNSTDSRSELVGEIDTRFVIGKVVIRLYPFSKFGSVD